MTTCAADFATEKMLQATVIKGQGWGAAGTEGETAVWGTLKSSLALLRRQAAALFETHFLLKS